MKNNIKTVMASVLALVVVVAAAAAAEIVI